MTQRAIIGYIQYIELCFCVCRKQLSSRACARMLKANMKIYIFLKLGPNKLFSYFFSVSSSETAAKSRVANISYDRDS